MKNEWKLLNEARLNLFDGEGGGDGAGAPAAQGETMGAAGDTGEQNQGNGETLSQSQEGAAAAEPTAEERRKAYFDLIRGDYKDIHTQEFQREIGKRMRSADRTIQNLQKQVDDSRGILDSLYTRYQVEDGNLEALSKALNEDNSYWAQAAEEAGMSVDQYRRTQELERKMDRMEREQRESQRSAAMQQQMAQWESEAEAMLADYPDFDLSAEVQNSTFMALLRNGFPMKNAYESAHVGDLVQKAARDAAQEAEKKVADSVRAKGSRPAENGTQQQAGFTVKTDVSKLTGKEIEDLVERARRGERITFS